MWTPPLLLWCHLSFSFFYSCKLSYWWLFPFKPQRVWQHWGICRSMCAAGPSRTWKGVSMKIKASRFRFVGYNAFPPFPPQWLQLIPSHVYPTHSYLILSYLMAQIKCYFHRYSWVMPTNKKRVALFLVFPFILHSLKKTMQTQNMTKC